MRKVVILGHVMHLASRALAAGAGFERLAPTRTMLMSHRPVVSICAVRTGCGKGAVTRRIGSLLRARGRRIAVLRHPMPYGDLAAARVQRFASFADLAAAGVTLEEREEYEPHLESGSVVFAGVDYQAILDAAEQEADVILWDGGNNDLPFVRPTRHFCLVDPHRAGDESTYHPGEANLRMADVVVITKEDAYPTLGPVLPAMGYGAGQMADLAATINATPRDVVLVGTPFDLARSLQVRHRTMRVRYEARECGATTFDEVLEGL